MVASHAVIADTPESIVLEMSKRMETLAAAGDWDDVEDIATRLRSAVLEVPEADRRSVLLAVLRSTDKVADEAKTARQTVSAKIKELRLGQVAKKAYELR